MGDNVPEDQVLGAKAEEVEATVLGAKAEEVEVTVLGAEDINFEEAAQEGNQLETKQAVEQLDADQRQEQFFWHIPLPGHLLACLLSFVGQFSFFYGSMYVERSDFEFKSYLRGVPWIPQNGLFALAAACMRTAFLGKVHAADWLGFPLVVCAVSCITPVLLFLIPHIGFVLVGLIIGMVVQTNIAIGDKRLNKRLGRSTEEVKQYEKFMEKEAVVSFFSFIVGSVIGLLYTQFGQQVPVLPDIALALGLAGIERVCLLLSLHSASKAPKFAPPRHFPITASIGTFFTESFKLACMISVQIVNPESKGYITVLLTSFVLNVSFRTGWTNYALTTLAARLTGKTMFVPNIGNLILREAKLCSGYGRLLYPAAVMLARLCHQTEQLWYFNDTVPLVLALVLAEMVVEDIMVAVIKRMDWLAPVGALEKAYYDSRPEGSLEKAYTWSADGKAVRTFTMRKFPTRSYEAVVHLYLQANANFLGIYALTSLVSVNYLYGLGGPDVKPAANAVDGAVVFLSN